MTEAEWRACADPYAMLRFLGERAGERKLRLFAAACCRRAWHLVEDAELKAAVELLERFADGRARDADRERALRVGIRFAESNVGRPQGSVGWEVWAGSAKAGARSALDAGESAAAAFGYAAGDSSFFDAKRAERREQAALLRDLFGDVFRPVTTDPAWVSADARGLAEAAYDERSFERLPILADALEEAGCDQADLLAHLRGPGPHARGCWALDLVRSVD